MSLKSVFRPLSDAAAIEGTATDQQRNELERQVPEARLDLARRQTNLTGYLPDDTPMTYTVNEADEIVGAAEAVDATG